MEEAFQRLPLKITRAGERCSSVGCRLIRIALDYDSWTACASVCLHPLYCLLCVCVSVDILYLVNAGPTDRYHHLATISPTRGAINWRWKAASKELGCFYQRLKYLGLLPILTLTSQRKIMNSNSSGFQYLSCSI